MVRTWLKLCLGGVRSRGSGGNAQRWAADTVTPRPPQGAVHASCTAAPPASQERVMEVSADANSAWRGASQATWITATQARGRTDGDASSVRVVSGPNARRNMGASHTRWTRRAKGEEVQGVLPAWRPAFEAPSRSALKLGVLRTVGEGQAPHLGHDRRHAGCASAAHVCRGLCALRDAPPVAAAPPGQPGDTERRLPPGAVVRRPAAAGGEQAGGRAA